MGAALGHGLLSFETPAVRSMVILDPVRLQGPTPIEGHFSAEITSIKACQLLSLGYKGNHDTDAKPRKLARWGSCQASAATRGAGPCGQGGAEDQDLPRRRDQVGAPARPVFHASRLNRPAGKRQFLLRRVSARYEDRRSGLAIRAGGRGAGFALTASSQPKRRAPAGRIADRSFQVRRLRGNGAAPLCLRRQGDGAGAQGLKEMVKGYQHSDFPALS